MNSVRTVSRNGHFSISVWSPWWREGPELISIWGDDEVEAGMGVIGPCAIVNKNNLKYKHKVQSRVLKKPPQPAGQGLSVPSSGLLH